MDSWLNNSAVNPTGMGMNMNMGMSGMPRFQQPLPHYEIIQVSGENGVDAFPMGPNSSILLADQTAPIVWLVRTDGAGYKSMKIPYDITPHKATPLVDLDNLEQRIKHLEDIINAKSQSNNKQSRKQQQVQSELSASATD